VLQSVSNPQSFTKIWHLLQSNLLVWSALISSNKAIFAPWIASREHSASRLIENQPIGAQSLNQSEKRFGSGGLMR
jgi:hypothetical protein